MLMWNVVEIDDVEEVECRKHVNVIHMPSPGLRHIRVGGLASHCPIEIIVIWALICIVLFMCACITNLKCVHI